MINRHIISSLAAMLVAIATTASALAASSSTLHVFTVKSSSKLLSKDGQALSPDSKLAVGDVVVSTKKAYAGTALHHAANAEGTVVTSCKLMQIISAGDVRATCTATMSLGSSTLTAETGTLNAADMPKHFTATTTGGTGRFSGDHGKWTVTRLNKLESDIEIQF